MMNLGSGAGLAGLRKMECAPGALKPLQITGLFKSRDMIIQYTMCDMVGIFDCCQVKILYTLPDQVVLYCIIVSYCIMLHHIVLHCIIGYKYIDIMLSIAVKQKYLTAKTNCIILYYFFFSFFAYIMKQLIPCL